MSDLNLKDYSGTIAAGLALVGLGLTAFFSYRAGKKAATIPVPEDKRGRAKRFGYIYGPAIASGVVAAGSIIASDRFHVGREAVLAGTASLAGVYERDLRDFEAAVRKEVGDEKATEIKEKVLEERMNRAEVPRNDNPALDLLVYEPYTDQYIWTSRETLAWTMLEANKKLTCSYDCRLNYIIKMLGGKAKPRGDELGWNWENEVQTYNWGYYSGPWIQIQTELRQEGPRKVLWLFYTVDPETQRPEDMIYAEGN